MSLTVIIPAKNEETFISGALESVSFADEILVLDSGSTDSTATLAQKYGAKVIKYDWQGFAFAHNFGAQKAKGDWLLYLDCDERVSPKLKKEILSVLNDPKSDAYQLPRKNFIMGKWLKHGGWYPDYVTRLIKADALNQWVGDLHEYPLINGTTGQLSSPIYHLSHRGLAWMLHKSITYTRLNAQLLHEVGHPPVKVRNFFGAMAREFYFRAIRHSGWKDGFLGWLEIIYQTFNAFLIQVWLWQFQQTKTMKQTYHQLDQEIRHEL